MHIFSTSRLLLWIFLFPILLHAKDRINYYNNSPALTISDRGKSRHNEISTNFCGQSITAIIDNILADGVPGSGSAGAANTKEIKILMYELNDETYIKKLIDAANAGAKIRILLNYSDSLTSPGRSPVVLIGAYNRKPRSNRICVKGLEGYRSARSTIGIMHQKTAIFTSQGKQYLMTGSFNWTNNASINNYENCIVLQREAPFTTGSISTIGDAISKADSHFIALWGRPDTRSLGEDFEELPPAAKSTGPSLPPRRDDSGAGGGGASGGEGSGSGGGGKGGTSGVLGGAGSSGPGKGATSGAYGGSSSYVRKRPMMAEESPVEVEVVPQEGLSRNLSILSPSTLRSGTIYSRYGTVDDKVHTPEHVPARGVEGESTAVLSAGVSLHRPNLPLQTGEKQFVYNRRFSVEEGDDAYAI